MNTATHFRFTKNDDNPTVKRLLRAVEPVVDDMPCLPVLGIFQENPQIFALPVVNARNEPVGIVERHAFVETFIKPYTHEIYGKKPIAEFMNQAPLIVSSHTSIDDISRIIIDAGMQHMVSGFIVTEHGQYAGIANGHDLLDEITQRKQANLFYLAHFDQLTKLPNRVLFMDRLSMAIAEASRVGSQIGLLFIDLDKFKHFNDSMGHAFGDQLLIAMAGILTRCSREMDTVARLSGDEFTIIADNITGQKDLDSLCWRILDTLKLPQQIMGREVFISASIGTVIFPRDDQDANNLLVKADAAMYEAKRSGRNTYRHYTAGMRLYSLDRMSLETDLRVAIERNEFELYYQPQVALDSGRVVGKEALIRWHHPQRGLLTPIHFIEIAEETGLIVAIGQWVIREACRQHQAWLKDGLQPMRISVNISAMQFYQSDFCDMVEDTIHATGINPSYLEFELTESMFMQDADAVVRTLRKLHGLGIKLAIDDFGTGYSNLSYLRKFPIDRLKVDQSFIKGIEHEPVNVEIVKTIAALARSMSLELVAEGVETDVELHWAESSGCTFVQGYRFSQPLPAEKFARWVAEYKHQVNQHTLGDM
ncbi:EAL domain-containing protein [Methylobacillus arboreus]|uniref:putative bifunctional diguanylate cyclase/phosphodiesterase n=1 Tax=Methylobacillus arboreus TaxID=755170 RepID=UPI001E62E7D2|nr:EAL domain-containing protein [Methylobacillus arboreus]MCB5190632.1 EAL domain-containing protein [Methylobacillus arboreus]